MSLNLATLPNVRAWLHQPIDASEHMQPRERAAFLRELADELGNEALRLDLEADCNAPGGDAE